METPTQTQAYALAGLGALAQPQVTLLPTPVPLPPNLHEVKRSISATASELATADKELKRFQRGSWPEAQERWLQKSRRFIERKRLLRTPSTIVYPLVGTVIGAGAGAIAAFGCESPTVGAAILGVGLSVGWGTPLVSLALKKLAMLQEKLRHRYMLEPKALRKPIQRFNNATGNDKLQVGYGIEKLLRELDRAQLLAPEGVRSLQLIVDENKQAEAGAHKEAGRYNVLAKQLAEPISYASTQTLQQILSQTSNEDRPVYAQAIYDLVFANRSRIAQTAYADRNALLKVLTDAGANPVIETGK